MAAVSFRDTGFSGSRGPVEVVHVTSWGATDRSVFAPQEAGARSAERFQAAAVWAVAFVWLALMAWCIHVVFTVSALRTAVEDRAGWVTRVEAQRRQVVALVTEVQQAGVHRTFSFAPGVRAALAEGDVFRDAPLPEGRPVPRHPWPANDVLAAGDALDGRVPARHPAEVADLLAAARAFDEATDRVADEVRTDLHRLRGRLGYQWNALYGLAVVSLSVLAAFVLVLWRWRRETLVVRLRERHFRTLVQAAQDLIWSVDAEGRWTFINEAARRIYGYAPEEMLGRSQMEVIAPEQQEPNRDILRRVLGGETLHYETVHVRKDGRRVVLLGHATAMRDTKGRVNGAMGSATDVTEMRAMQERLLLNERLQAVATLGSGVAHDFSNLLTVIAGQAQVAKAKEKGLSPQLQRRLNSILETAERARKLTQQLIAFGRRQHLRKEVVDLVAVVRQMGDLVRNLAGDEIRIQEILSDRPVRVRADWGQIEQVVMNFVLNARDAMPEGGTITISVQQCALTGAEAKSLGLKEGAWALVEVSDDGAGMSEDVLGRIFEPFFTTKGAGKGTGLGLATVYSVVHQHGGTVIPSSTVGSGTCMRVFLPAVTDPREEAADAPAALAGASAGS